jgi:hypothetical protein
VHAVRGGLLLAGRSLQSSELRALLHACAADRSLGGIRCVMTTLAQDELPKDTDVLRTLTRHNRVLVDGAGLFPWAGVYAVVEAPGTLRTGDCVVLS